jgi:hypothetical protein
VTNEILQTLPSSRQRNSLLSVGMNLNIPDEDPHDAADANVYKKRFSISNYSSKGFECRQVEERENKIPRIKHEPADFLAPMDCDDSHAINLSTHRRASHSLMDLSAACEKERCQLPDPRRGVPTPASSFSLLSSSSLSSSLNSAAIVKRPLQSSANVRVVQIGGAGQAAANRWVGFGRSKTVIALVSPTNGTSNCFPAVQTSPVSLVMRKRTSFD